MNNSSSTNSFLTKSIAIVVQNIRRFRANFDHFVTHVPSLPNIPDLFFFTETCIRDFGVNNYFLNDFVTFANCNESYRSGGVAAFVRNNITVNDHRKQHMNSADCLIL